MALGRWVVAASEKVIGLVRPLFCCPQTLIWPIQRILPVRWARKWISSCRLHFSINFGGFRMPQIHEKPKKNHCFSMVFIYFTKLLLNRKKAPTVRPKILKIEARGLQNDPAEYQNEPHELRNDARQRGDGSSKCRNGAPAGS